MQDLVKAASAFAHAAHAASGHKRKYTGEDYIAHPANVASLVANSAHASPETIAAAWLHDVVEDCPGIDAGMIEYFFGAKVRQLVQECSHIDRTDDPRKLNRFERMAIELARAADISPEAKTIKLADLLDNTATIVAHDLKFAQVYMAEKRRLVMVLVGGDQGLWVRAATQVNAYFFPTAPGPVVAVSESVAAEPPAPPAVDPAKVIYPGWAKPTEDGIYMRQCYEIQDFHYCKWKDGYWRMTASSIEDARTTDCETYSPTHAWRGPVASL